MEMSHEVRCEADTIGCVRLEMGKRVNTSKSFWGSFQGFILIASIVVALWIANFFVHPFFFGQPESAGVAGDMFGALTSLFSGLAFAGLISTLLMQRQELELQRGELELSRNEFQLQRYETVFFNLLRLFNEHVASLTVSYTTGTFGAQSRVVITGKDALSRFVEKMPTEISVGFSNGVNLDDVKSEAKRISFEEQMQKYDAFFDRDLEKNIGPYFRLLYNILRHIDESDLDDDQKVKYARILRAYLGLEDAKLLLIHCVSKKSRNLVRLVEKYSILKHLSEKDARENPSAFKMLPDGCFEYRRFAVE